MCREALKLGERGGGSWGCARVGEDVACREALSACEEGARAGVSFGWGGRSISAVSSGCCAEFYHCIGGARGSRMRRRAKDVSGELGRNGMRCEQSDIFLSQVLLDAGGAVQGVAPTV